MLLSSPFYYTTAFILARAPLGDYFSYLYNRGYGVRLYHELNSVKGKDVSCSCVVANLKNTFELDLENSKA